MTNAESEPPLNRRSFLKWVGGISAAFTALLVGIPSIRAFFSPSFARPPKKDWVKVAEADLVDIETPVKVDFVEATNDAWVENRALRTVWLYTEDGEKFTAYSGVCTHLGCSFTFDAAKKQYHCPCHHGLFDMKTGAVLGGPPPRPLDLLPVKVDKGAVYVMYETFRTGISAKVQT